MKRLTPALLTVIMFGVVGLLVAAYVAKTLLAAEQRAPEPTEELIPMAIADIAPGTLVTEDHLGRGPFPKVHFEPDMLRTNRVIAGRYARTLIRSNQPIRANDLLPPGDIPSLRVAEGMRAISVEVGDSTAMVDGMIKPGEFVDVLFTYNAGNDDTYQGGLTMRLFEGVRLLAVNRNTASSRVERGNNHVTLELSEPQTNVITLARDRGAVTLTYNPNGRGNGGLALSSAERVTLYDILGLKPAEPQEPFQTEIYRGSSRAANQFNDKGKLIDSSSPDAGNRLQQLPPNPAGNRQPMPTTGAVDNEDEPTDRPTAPTAIRRLFDKR